MECITYTENANLKGNMQCCAQADWFDTQGYAGEGIYAQDTYLVERKVARM